MDYYKNSRLNEATIFFIFYIMFPFILPKFP